MTDEIIAGWEVIEGTQERQIRNVETGETLYFSDDLTILTEGEDLGTLYAHLYRAASSGS